MNNNKQFYTFSEGHRRIQEKLNKAHALLTNIALHMVIEFFMLIFFH